MIVLSALLVNHHISTMSAFGFRMWSITTYNFSLLRETGRSTITSVQILGIGSDHNGAFAWLVRDRQGTTSVTNAWARRVREEASTIRICSVQNKWPIERKDTISDTDFCMKGIFTTICA